MRQRGFTLIELLVGLVLLGVTATAVVTLVTSASTSAGQEVTVAAQNAKLRSAMSIIQGDLSQANNPFIALDTTAPDGSTTTAPPTGNGVTFSRATDAAVGTVYERIQYNGPTASATRLKNTITVQTSTTKPNDWTTVAYKVILDKVPSMQSTPLFKYYANATTTATYTTSTAWLSTVGLIDVTLRRDEDIPVGASAGQLATAATAVRYPPTRLSTSVYIRNVASQIEGRGDDASCR